MSREGVRPGHSLRKVVNPGPRLEQPENWILPVGQIEEALAALDTVDSEREVVPPKSLHGLRLALIGIQPWEMWNGWPAGKTWNPPANRLMRVPTAPSRPRTRQVRVTARRAAQHKRVQA